MYWNKKYQELALQVKLTPSATNIWQWILRQTRGKSEPVELRIDLKKFNKYIERHRYKAYDPKTLKTAMRLLIERLPELLVVMEKVTNYYYILLVRPISYFNREENLKLEKASRASETNPAYSNESAIEGLQQQQQCIEYAEKIFNQELKLNFDSNALRKIAKYVNNSKELILKGYQYLLTRYNGAIKAGSRMLNPAGYLITAFRHNVISEWNLYYDAAIPQVKSVSEIINLTKNVSLKYGVNLS